MIEINRSAKDVFDFSTNPECTPLWIEHILKEEATPYPPVREGWYENTTDGENWDGYVVAEVENGKLFELENQDGYHVRYTYKDLGNGKSEMEYYEWTDVGMLGNPFTMDVMEKLKAILENEKS